jgi:NitT/TauT family transport system permease protein
MSDHPRFWGLHAQPSRSFSWLLAALPFILVILVYLGAVEHFHSQNPNYKILPTFGQMADAVDRMAFTEDRRTGDYLLWVDTLASLIRLVVGVTLAAAAGLFIGLYMGIFPGLRALLGPGLTFVSMIPPLAILPILFIVVGVDEAAKITLIFVGVFPLIARDILLATQKIPAQQITKALSLGASQLGVAYRIILPQIMPRLL